MREKEAGDVANTIFDGRRSERGRQVQASRNRKTTT